MNWFRFYTNSLDNPKVQMLQPDLFKFWVNILCVARLHEGVLPARSDLWFRMRADPEWGERCLQELIKRGFLDETPSGLMPHDWEEHQYPSDNSALRMRKLRAKKRSDEQVTSPVTNLSRARTEQSRTEQNRTDNARSADENQNLPEKTTPQSRQPLDIDAVRSLIIDFPGAKLLSGLPDDRLCIQVASLAENSVERLGSALRALHLSGKKPELSWGWFSTVLKQQLARRASV